MSEITEKLEREIERIEALAVSLQLRAQRLAAESLELPDLYFRAEYRRNEAGRLRGILDMLELEEDQELTWKHDWNHELTS